MGSLFIMYTTVIKSLRKNGQNYCLKKEKKQLDIQSWTGYTSDCGLKRNMLSFLKLPDLMVSTLILPAKALFSEAQLPTGRIFPNMQKITSLFLFRVWAPDILIQ